MKKIIIFTLVLFAIGLLSCKSTGPEKATSRTVPESRIEKKSTVKRVMPKPALIKNKTVTEEKVSFNHKKSNVLTSEDIEALPTKSISEIAATSAGVSVDTKGDISIRSGRSEATVYYIDGIRVSGAEAAKMIAPAAIYPTNPSQISGTPAEYKSEARDYGLEIEPLRPADYIPEPKPEPGLLTAAEWNDLKNWDDWMELQESGAYQTMVDYWNMSGMKRHSVFVTNEQQVPLANQNIELVSKRGDVYWSAVTDNNGSAELWVSDSLTESYELVAASGGKVIVEESQIDGGYSQFKLDASCETESTLDIMFVVDATGSMQDEIDFLRAELGNVISRVESAAMDAESEVRLGTVFYKDKHDDYLTAFTPLHKEANRSIDFINKKDAGGGGDHPEAVDAALELALDQDWNENAINRLLFLILDAPPHHNDTVLKRIKQQIKKAAALGIKIIPITASGIDRETEYLMKQMAVFTNGTYIFLTDDSGIGAPHLEHVIPDYEVELLNNLLVRVISGYAKVLDCDQPMEQMTHSESRSMDMKVYPNPSSGQITITTSAAADQLVVTSTSGKILFSVDKPSESEQIDLSALISGIYQVSCTKNGQRVSTQQVIKI